MGWVLIELPMLDMRIPTATMSAFVEEPYDALNGVGPEDWLPIQGVAFDRGRDDEYVGTPAIAFPPVNGVNVGTINEEKKIFSLMVNLSEFSSGDTVRIGLYGFVHSYSIAGGFGEDSPFQGVVSSSTFYGSVTRDYRAIALATPAALAAAPYKLFINADFASGGLGRTMLLSSFPELATYPYEYLTDGEGDKGFFVEFDSLTPGWQEGQPFVMTDKLGHHVTHSDPTNNPDPFIILPLNSNWIANQPPDFRLPYSLLADASLQSTAYWRDAWEKTVTMRCSTAQLYSPGPNTYTNVTTFAGRDSEVVGAFVWGFDQVQYHVPTWYFDNDRPMTVRWAFSEPLLWTQQALRVYPRPANSYTWETADYPDRPEMTEIETAVIPSLDERLDPENPFNDYPYNHFGEPRIGTITILVGDGGLPGVTFVPEPAPPPADGTPDGTGPIGDGTAPGRTANPQLRAWTFSLDGHDFYVLRLGDFDGLVFDTYSEQWMDWNDFNSLTWRAHCGINWSGAEALAETYGSNVVAGDDAYGLLWFLDPEQPYDEAPGSGGPVTYFSRVTMGQVPKNGREVLPCYAAWLTADMGDPAYSGAAVTLWTSDDAGVTWDNHGYVSVTADENSPELSWYSLGQIVAPGRLFRIFDDGAITRIDALEMNDPDDEK